MTTVILTEKEIEWLDIAEQNGPDFLAFTAFLLASRYQTAVENILTAAKHEQSRINLA